MPQPLPRPDDPETRRRAALASGDVHQVLAAAGAWLRSADEEHRAEAEEALHEVEVAEALEALAAIDPGESRAALAEAFDEAFEAALEEDEEERAAITSATIELLDRRDAVECALVAATFVADRDAASTEATSLHEVASALRASLDGIDAVARRRTRVLSAVNPERRARAAELAPEHRAAAWWWSDRADEADDGLVELLAGRAIDAGARAMADVARAVLPERGDVLGAALRRIGPGVGDDAAASRLVQAEASRSEVVAAAERAARSIDVASPDVDA